jgi:peptidyl-tRNA hydrolase, PTH1 family
VQHYVLSDFAKSEKGWVEALIGIVADNADLIAGGDDATFQNKIHLAMVAKGFGDQQGDGHSNGQNNGQNNGNDAAPAGG